MHAYKAHLRIITEEPLSPSTVKSTDLVKGLTKEARGGGGGGGGGCRLNVAKEKWHIVPKQATLFFLLFGYITCICLRFVCLDSQGSGRCLDGIFSLKSSCDEDGIRTHACRAQWISSPSP